MPRKVHLIMAARPNIMKVAPLWHALRDDAQLKPVLVHTGQHYDPNLSDAFLKDLGLPQPDHSLGVGSGTHAEQTAAAMVAYERLCMEAPPDWVVVVGDVNSTVACALAAKKLDLPVAHLEAGLRSGDRTMPEEINRIATDAIVDLLWTPSEDGDAHLLREGVAPERIERVGNIMIDSLEMVRGRIEAEGTVARLGLPPGEFGVVTLHRPANVDRREKLEVLIDALLAVSERWPLVFPVHPRTAKRLKDLGLDGRLAEAPGITLTEPLSYIAFMNLVLAARFVATDSGGVQEETTYLNIPCFTVRPNTERPITVTLGTNQLTEPEHLAEAIRTTLSGPVAGGCPELWDGKTAERVAASLRRHLGVSG